MHQATALLGLLAETSIHAGAGQMLGALDLPIQRESHTQWPCVYGTGVKGALRSRAVQLDAPDIDVVFGPDPATQQASEHAGALAVGDARLLLLPVRSLTGPFRWITCPALLERLNRDARRLGVSDLDLPIPDVGDAEALIPKEIPNLDHLFLEEFRVPVTVGQLDPLVQALARVLPLADAEAKLRRWLCVIDDTFFGDFARFATQVTTHVGLDANTKTVKDGFLRTEESLPPETVLYVPLVASRSRKKPHALDASEVMDRLLGGVFGQHAYLQLGGNETVGMGWCQVRPLRGGVA